MKKFIFGIILSSLFFSLVACSNDTISQNTNGVKTNVTDNKDNKKENKTSNEKKPVPTSVSITSKSNLDNWNIVPTLTKDTNGAQMVMVKFQHKKNVTVKDVQVSIGNGRTSLKVLKGGTPVALGSSFSDDRKMTFKLSWEENGIYTTGEAKLVLK
jgi:hypothetical protein